ncbi:MAG: HesA/MoeB/ThiF family protein [Fibrobacterota bacterium]
MDSNRLTPDDRDRYGRNLALKELGESGQRALMRSRVLIIGAGGLGSPAALYLAAAGIGTLGLADSDRVEVSNLQRQILHATPDVGRLKADSACARLAALNPGVRCEQHVLRVTAANIAPLISGYDFVLDCTDNFTSKFLINDACVFAGKSFCHAGVSDFRGQILTYAPNHACLRCLFREAPEEGTVPTTVEVGVLGAVAGTLGALQAVEAIKFLAGAGECLLDRMYILDTLSMEGRCVGVRRDPACPACASSFLQ